MSNWPRVALSQVATSVDYGVTASAATESVGPKFLRITDIQANAVDWRQVPWCECSERESKEANLQSGDIVFARTGATTGKTFLIEDCPEDAVFASYLIRVRLGSEIEPRFVNQFFQSKDYWAQISKGARGVAQPGVNATTLKALRIPLPPLPEQRRIAAVLDQADALRAKRREALAQLDRLTQSIFIEMFGDQQSQEWPIETIADVAALHDGAIRTGPFGSQLLHSEFVADGVAVLGIDNAVANEFRWGERRFISESKYRDLRRYTVKPGDVLITIMGTCGRCAVVPDDIPVSINTKHLCCITLNAMKCRPEFLHAYFLRHPMARGYLEQTSKGAIMSGLNMGLIKSMPISVPPLALQQTFATRIQAVEALKTTHRAALVELNALFASLQHRAFSGGL